MYVIFATRCVVCGVGLVGMLLVPMDLHDWVVAIRMPSHMVGCDVGIA